MICSCKPSIVHVKDSCNISNLLTEKLFKDAAADKVYADMYVESKKAIDKLYQDKHDLLKTCIQYRRPTRPARLCSDDMATNCQDHDLDIARQLDYLNELDRWARYSEALCGDSKLPPGI